MIKILLVAFAIFLCAPLVTFSAHPHQPIQAQIVTGIDHQQPTGDPPPLPPEAYPGQRTHDVPPEDFFCRRQTIRLDVDEAHACTCERMFDPDDPTVVREDSHCTVYCHAEKCSCGIAGAKPDGVPPTLR